MNIKKEIGQRIKQARKDAKLTQDELAAQLNVKKSRISAWERGIRRPLLEDIITIGNALSVEAAYLFCLSDTTFSDKYYTQLKEKLVPVIDNEEIINFKKILQADLFDNLKLYPHVLSEKQSGYAYFAIKITEKSMFPDLLIDDIVIIDPEREPEPGNFILIHSHANNKSFIRKLRQITQPDGTIIYHGIASNKDWPITILNEKDKILGVLIQQHRNL